MTTRTLNDRLSTIRVDLSFLELNQVLAAVQVRSVLLEQFLRGATTPESRALFEATWIDCQKAEGRLSAALMGEQDPDLALGDHFAGMPERCDHLGIGKPGCPVCDPLVDTIGLGRGAEL